MTHADFLRNAFRALLENFRAFLFYAAVALVLGIASVLFRVFIIAPMTDSASDTQLNLYLIAFQIGHVAITMAAATVTFARIGREVDKPMWRVADDVDALRLFYRMWILIGLIGLVSMQVVQLIASETSEPVTVDMFRVGFLVLIALLYAFGSCVMFYGRPGREEINQAFTTMSHHAGPVMMVCIIGVLAGFILPPLFVLLPLFLQPVVNVLDAYIDCFIFTFMWLVCIYNRDHYEHHEDDIDF